MYEGLDTVLSAPCAIKVLTVPERQRAALTRRLKNEAHAMAVVRHPNVLRVYDVGTDGDTDWIAMDLAPGGSLESLVEANGPMRPAEAGRYFVAVLSALQAAHDRGIVHRDVKPSNVLLSAHGHPLLADFGIALVDGEHSRSTRTGIAMGTLSYMAPEQRLDARAVDATADVYAVGTSLYVLVSGWTPMDLFTAEPDSQRWAPIPPPLREILIRATRFEPARRYRSAREMAEALEAALPALEALSPPVPAGGPAGRPRTPTVPAPPDHTVPATKVPPPGTTTAAAADPDGLPATLDRDLPRPLADLDPPSAPLGAPSESSTPRGPWGRAHAEAPTLPPRPAVERRGPLRRVAPLVVVVLAGAVVLAGLLWPSFAPSGAGDPTPARPGELPDGVGGPIAPPPPPVLAPAPAPEAAAPGAPAPEAAGPASAPRPDPGAQTGQPGDVPAAPSPQETAPPAPVEASGPVPIGRWRGTFQGRSCAVVLRGSPDALSGTVSVSFAGNQVDSEVRGRFDPASGELVLEDVADSEDAGSYRARLSADGRFEGAFTGRVRQTRAPFVWRRP